MAFTVPTFNLTANIWRGGSFLSPLPAPDVITTANLQYGPKNGLVPTWDVTEGLWIQPYFLLIPKLTDVRMASDGTPADGIEVPAGSGLYYLVWTVGDVGKGFANEYRVAGITLITFPLAENLPAFPFPQP